VTKVQSLDPRPCSKRVDLLGVLGISLLFDKMYGAGPAREIPVAGHFCSVDPNAMLVEVLHLRL